MIDRFRWPIIVVIDLVLVSLSVCLAFMIRFDWQIGPVLVESCLYFAAWACVIRVTLFALLGLYQWSFRHASVSEAVNLLKAVTAGTLLLVVVAFFTRKGGEIGRSVLLIDYLICSFLIGASRFLPRAFIKLKKAPHKNLKRALIVGAGSSGEMIVRALMDAQERTHLPIGFIDDNPRKMSLRIHGIKVLGTTNNMKDIIERRNINEVIIAVPSAKGKTIRDIISKCENREVKIKTVPGLHQILTGEVAIKEIRDVQPEDLLGREVVQIDTKNVKSFIRDKVILVTGAGGTIGSELCRQIVKFNPKVLIFYDHNENDIYLLELELKKNYPYLKFKTVIGDIKDIGLLKYTFSGYKPNVVFHSAAHKHVPLMEDNSVAAVKNNIIGTRNFMYAAEHYGVESFVMISTDKAVNPTSIMGSSKRIAEMLIQAKAKNSRTKFMAVRFGNVIGSNGSVVPIFKKQIKEGGPITVTHPEVKRYFMTVQEAAQLVIQAGAIGKGGEIFILDMGEQIKIIDLAKNLITLSGLKLNDDISIKFVGLRRGEKLYEETLHDIEKDEATKHNRIYITQCNDFDRRVVMHQVKELERLANIMANERIISKIKEIVPSYHLSKNNHVF